MRFANTQNSSVFITPMQHVAANFRIGQVRKFASSRKGAAIVLFVFIVRQLSCYSDQWGIPSSLSKEGCRLLLDEPSGVHTSGALCLWSIKDGEENLVSSWQIKPGCSVINAWILQDGNSVMASVSEGTSSQIGIVLGKSHGADLLEIATLPAGSLTYYGSCAGKIAAIGPASNGGATLRLLDPEDKEQTGRVLFSGLPSRTSGCWFEDGTRFLLSSEDGRSFIVDTEKRTSSAAILKPVASRPFFTSIVAVDSKYALVEEVLSKVL